MLQKLKQLGLSALIILTFFAPVALTQMGFAAPPTPCKGTDAQYPALCSSIPLGCPGSTQQGPVNASANLACPWDPTVKFTCQAKQCSFPKISTLKHGETYTPPNSGGGGGTGNGNGSGSGNGGSTNGNVSPSAGDCSKLAKCDLVTKYLNPFINFMAAFVGVAVVISLIIGGIQYSSSAGDPQKVGAAKNRIRNAIIALVTFLFLYALLNFLIPGGLV